MVERLPSYGGQALIEGVLMRGRYALAAAFRRPDGGIEVIEEPLTGIYLSKLAMIPFLRGLILLWDALGLGIKYLTFSANLQSGEDEKIEGPALYLTLFASLALSVLLFFVLPTGIGQLLGLVVPISPWGENLIESLFRICIVLGYIWGVGQLSEIKRVFGYHGAEHKTINAFENGADLTVENVLPYSLVHARCGTSFLLTVIVLSVLVFSILGPLPPLTRYLSRILLIPLLVSVAYEYIRWAANHSRNTIVRWLIKPNLWLQKLTTRQPSPDMIEVALAAFNAMIALEGKLAAPPKSEESA